VFVDTTPSTARFSGRSGAGLNGFVAGIAKRCEAFYYKQNQALRSNAMLARP
jgi:hypothetical protein